MSDDAEPHRSRTEVGAKLFIVDEIDPQRQSESDGMSADRNPFAGLGVTRAEKHRVVNDHQHGGATSMPAFVSSIRSASSLL